jgi:methanogenic corrinoid protein MtbC1
MKILCCRSSTTHELRDEYIVMVGGAPLNDEFGQAVGADAYCRDAATAVEVAKRLIAEQRAAAA